MPGHLRANGQSPPLGSSLPVGVEGVRDDKQIYIADSSGRYEETLSQTRKWGGTGEWSSPALPPPLLPRELEEVGMKLRPAPRESAPVTMGHLGEGNDRCTALGVVTEESPKNTRAR